MYEYERLNQYMIVDNSFTEIKCIEYNKRRDYRNLNNNYVIRQILYCLISFLSLQRSFECKYIDFEAN